MMKNRNVLLEGTQRLLLELAAVVVGDVVGTTDGVVDQRTGESLAMSAIR